MRGWFSKERDLSLRELYLTAQQHPDLINYNLGKEDGKEKENILIQSVKYAYSKDLDFEAIDLRNVLREIIDTYNLKLKVFEADEWGRPYVISINNIPEGIFMLLGKINEKLKLKENVEDFKKVKEEKIMSSLQDLEKSL